MTRPDLDLVPDDEGDGLDESRIPSDLEEMRAALRRAAAAPYSEQLRRQTQARARARWANRGRQINLNLDE